MKKTTWLGIVILSGCAADSLGEKGGSGLAEFADCDGYARNGAETDIASDPLNCGGCGHACEPAGSYGGAYCEQGKCILLGCPTYEGAVTASECALDDTGCPRWRFSRDERLPTYVGEIMGDGVGPEPLIISGVGEAQLVVRVNETVSDELGYGTDIRGEAALFTSASDPNPDYALNLDVDGLLEYRSQCPWQARDPYNGWQVSGTCYLEVTDSIGWYDDSFDLKIHVSTIGRGEDESCEPWQLKVL